MKSWSSTAMMSEGDDLPLDLAPAALSGATLSAVAPAEGLRTADDQLAPLVEATLRDARKGLRFPGALEARFMADTAAQRLQTLRLSGTLAAFLLNLFLVADVALLPDVIEASVQWRAFVFTPLCLLAMGLLGSVSSLRLRELVLASVGVFASILHIHLCAISSSPHSAAYTTGLAVLLLHSHVFVRPRFWAAVGTSLAVLMCFVVSIWAVQGHTPPLTIPIGLMLVSTAIFTLYYLYTLEHEERFNYLRALHQRLLQSQLARANKQLEQMSRHDALTSLANRRHFDEVLGQVWARAQGRSAHPVSIIILDVDHFKAYNDHHGHPAGDACLVQVAKALRDSLRRPGDLVARYGGEEFIAVLDKAPLSMALAAAERVRASVEALYLPHGAAFAHDHVTVSLGVATMCPEDRQASAQGLIIRADEALYQAKNRGRNRVWPTQAETFAAPCRA